MHTLATVISLAFIALIAYLLWNIYSQYRTATGTMWERLLASARSSATMLWGKFCLIIAGIVGNLDNIASFIGGQDAVNFINTWVGNPKAIASIMMAISLMSMASRLRTL